MRVRRLLPFVLILGLLLVGSLVPLIQRAISSRSSPSPETISTGQLPVSFEANQGQTDNQVRFLAHGPGYTLFLTPQESLLALNASGHGGLPSSSPFSPGIADPFLLT